MGLRKRHREDNNDIEKREILSGNESFTISSTSTESPQPTDFV